MLARLRLSPRGARRGDALAVLALLAAPGEQRRAVRLERGRRMSFGSCWPPGATVVSGRNTIGASRPLLAWTVSTRTPSLSRLQVALDLCLVRLDLGEEPGAATGASLRSWASASARNSSIGSAASCAEPADQRLAAAVLAEQARVEGVRATSLAARARQSASRPRGLRGLASSEAAPARRRASPVRSGRERDRARRRRGRSAGT